MKRHNSWERISLSLAALLASAAFVDTFLFCSRNLLCYCGRSQSSKHVLFDRRLSEVIFDNETVQAQSRRIHVHLFSPRQVSKDPVQGKGSVSSAALDLSKPKNQPEIVTSSFRALEQINALFDLANDKGDDFRPAVSTDLVLTALESFVTRVRMSVQEGSRSGEGLLSAIECLICRVNEIDTSPTLSTVESAWWIFQQERQNGTRVFAQPQRTIRLLRNWTAWSEKSGTPLYGRPPPMQLALQLFRDTVEMSSELWDFYLSFVRHPSSAQSEYSYTKYSYKSKDIPFESQFFELSRLVLQILSRSGLEWESLQCQVIQRIVRIPTISEQKLPELIMGELTEEIWGALHASANAGRVAGSGWLARFIVSTTPDINETAIIEIHTLIYKSMYHSHDAGSLLCMERFLWEHQRNQKWGLPFNGTTCQMLLSKYAQASAMNPYYTTASLGRCAERFMHRAYQKLYCERWHPDIDCAVYVLESYLPNTVGHIGNASLLLSRVRKADYFVRDFVRQFHLKPKAGNEKDEVKSRTQIFERLLGAYYDVVLMAFQNDDDLSRLNTKRVAQKADELFRFYLIHHRDGRIRTEIPSESHIQQLIQIFDICNRANTTITIDIPQKVSEYRHIIRSFNTLEASPIGFSSVPLVYNK